MAEHCHGIRRRFRCRPAIADARGRGRWGVHPYFQSRGIDRPVLAAHRGVGDGVVGWVEIREDEAGEGGELGGDGGDGAVESRPGADGSFELGGGGQLN